MAKEIKNKSEIEWQIVELIKDKRTSLKISQAKIAAQLGVTPGYIGQIEMRGSASMYTYDQLNELAKFFNCSPKDFMPENALE